MTTHETLNVVTLIMCVITLTISSLALMPQIKQGLAILRDGVLWAVLLGIVVAVGAIGWHRLVQARHGREQTAADRPAADRLADRLADNPRREDHFATISDPYPAGHRPWTRAAAGGGHPSRDGGRRGF